MLRASFDKDGLVGSLHIESAGDAISPRWLSAALHGRIDIKQGVIEQTNFPTYPSNGVARAPTVANGPVSPCWRTATLAALGRVSVTKRWRAGFPVA